jgi:hypothetical protein
MLTNALKSDATPEADDSCGTMKHAFLNKLAQSRLKPGRVLVVETWMVLIPVCRVP